MTRRSLMTRGGLFALGALIPFHKSQANEAELVVGAQITRNHGHLVSLSLSDIVLLMREATETESPVTIGIQGDSSHPHFVSLTAQDLMDLLFAGEIQTRSTVNAGHAHGVLITLN